jgi:hypothetical protein
MSSTLSVNIATGVPANQGAPDLPPPTSSSPTGCSSCSCSYRTTPASPLRLSPLPATSSLLAALLRAACALDCAAMRREIGTQTSVTFSFLPSSKEETPLAAADEDIAVTAPSSSSATHKSRSRKRKRGHHHHHGGDGGSKKRRRGSQSRRRRRHSHRRRKGGKRKKRKRSCASPSYSDYEPENPLLRLRLRQQQQQLLSRYVHSCHSIRRLLLEFLHDLLLLHYFALRIFVELPKEAICNLFFFSPPRLSRKMPIPGR